MELSGEIVMDDLIRRQDAIDALREAENHAFNSFYKGLVKAHKIIADIPSAQTERMVAKWIVTTSLQEGQITWKDYKCSNCSHHRGKPMNFCEVCGAKMER